MGTSIIGGSSSLPADVTSDNRLQTSGRSESALAAEAAAGKGFTANSDAVSCTSANKTALLFIQNPADAEADLVITEIRLAAGASTSGTGQGTYHVDLGHTAGTIVSGATAVTVHNLDSAKPAIPATQILAYVGANEETATGGTDDVMLDICSASDRVPDRAVNFRLPPGESLTLLCTPPASNTAMNVYAGVTGYIESLGL